MEDLNKKFNSQVRIASAQILGTAAFKAGKKRIPYQNKEVMELVEDLNGLGTHPTAPYEHKLLIAILDSFIKGWDNANIYGSHKAA